MTRAGVALLVAATLLGSGCAEATIGRPRTAVQQAAADLQQQLKADDSASRPAPQTSPCVDSDELPMSRFASIDGTAAPSRQLFLVRRTPRAYVLQRATPTGSVSVAGGPIADPVTVVCTATDGRFVLLHSTTNPDGVNHEDDAEPAHESLWLLDTAALRVRLLEDYDTRNNQRHDRDEDRFENILSRIRVAGFAGDAVVVTYAVREIRYSDSDDEGAGDETITGGEWTFSYSTTGDARTQVRTPPRASDDDADPAQARDEVVERYVRRLVDGSAVVDVVANPTQPDLHAVVARYGASYAEAELFVVRHDGDGAPRTIARQACAPTECSHARWSPDGTWMTTQSTFAAQQAGPPVLTSWSATTSFVRQHLDAVMREPRLSWIDGQTAVVLGEIDVDQGTSLRVRRVMPARQTMIVDPMLADYAFEAPRPTYAAARIG